VGTRRRGIHSKRGTAGCHRNPDRVGECVPRLGVELPCDLRFGNHQVDHRGDDATVGAPGRNPEHLTLSFSIWMNRAGHTVVTQELRDRLQFPGMSRDSAELDLRRYRQDAGSRATEL